MMLRSPSPRRATSSFTCDPNAKRWPNKKRFSFPHSGFTDFTRAPGRVRICSPHKDCIECTYFSHRFSRRQATPGHCYSRCTPSTVASSSTLRMAAGQPDKGSVPLSYCMSTCPTLQASEQKAASILLSIKPRRNSQTKKSAYLMAFPPCSTTLCSLGKHHANILAIA